jgi:hypothetical protein
VASIKSDILIGNSPADKPGGVDRRRVDERLDQVLDHGYGRVEVIVQRGKIVNVQTTLSDVE